MKREMHHLGVIRGSIYDEEELSVVETSPDGVTSNSHRVHLHLILISPSMGRKQDYKCSSTAL